MESQNRQILEHLQSGRDLTALDALRLFGCFRLASRIKELRKAGHDIVTYMDEYTTAEGVTKKIGRYSLRTEAK